MEKYEARQYELREKFKEELTELLKKYRANFWVESDDLTIEVELKELISDDGKLVEPYVYFILPRSLP